MELNYYTCAALAIKYKITIEKFFILNLDVDRSCNNLKPNTDYCVKGCKCVAINHSSTPFTFTM